MKKINEYIKLLRNPKTQITRKFHSILDPKAPFVYVEAFKTLRTNLEFISSANDVKSIVVTSALPEESKSTVSVNLAMSLADSGKSVVLVECDLRKPILRKYMKLGRNTRGIASYLAGKAGINECIIDDIGYGISIMPVDFILPNPSELLNSEKMRVLVEELREKYDYVILDAPPVTVVTDAAVVGRMADGAILIVRSKFAPTNTVRLAKQRLEAVNVNVLGAVVTRFDIKKSGWQNGYKYKNYEYGYYGHAENKR